MARVLVVDDEQGLLTVLSVVLTKQGHEVFAAQDGNKALDILNSTEIDLMISDIRMAPVDGITLLKQAKEIKPELAVIMVTAFSSVDTAIEAQKLGAFDYVPKPFKLDELLETIQKALRYQGDQNAGQGGEPAYISVHYYFDQIVAQSEAMMAACDVVKQAGPVDAPVLVAGEHGTGKELLARSVHSHSLRCEKPYDVIDCATTTDVDIERILFSEDSVLASGSVYLNNIDSLSAALQRELTAAIKDKAVKSGAEFDVRIIGGTCDNLELLVKKGKFRDDLGRLLSHFVVKVPSLCDRKVDVEQLVYHILRQESDSGIEVKGIDAEAISILQAHKWPENYDQLKDTVLQAITKLENGMITKSSIPASVVAAAESQLDGGKGVGTLYGRGKSLKKFIHNEETVLLEKIVEQAGGDKLKAARALNMSLATLNRKLGQE